MLRRRAVLQGGVAGAAALAAPGLMRHASAAPADPMQFIGWQYQPEIVAENVGIFSKLYDENVNYELVPGEYHAVAETKLIGGQHIDMMYSEEDRLIRWNTAGWTRSLEGLPGIEEIKAGMYPINVHNMSLADGSLGGLPYYTGLQLLRLQREASGCGQARAAGDLGGVPRPVPQAEEGQDRRVSRTSAPGAGSGPACPGACSRSGTREGAKVFDAEHKPDFDQDFRDVLEMHKTIYEEQLIPQDVMTQLGESVPNFATGQHTYMVVHEYDQKVFNTPSMSQIAGACRNAIMPGKTRSTFIWTAVYQMGANPIDTDRVWNLMQFFGGKAKDGKYHVATRWALEFGLGTPHKEVINSPEVQEAFSKWKDMEVAAKQQETATTRDVAKTIWFPEWDWYMMGEVQDYVRGQQSTDQLVDKLQAKYDELKQQYPE